jgi:hypothetical protein
VAGWLYHSLCCWAEAQTATASMKSVDKNLFIFDVVDD